MTRSQHIEHRINTYQKRLEWYRAHNVYGIVNGEPGWVYESAIEEYECRIEELEQQLQEVESNEMLDVLDWEMHRYEQTKFIKRALGRLVEAFLWLPSVIVLGIYGGYFMLNIVALGILILIVRYAWNEIRVSKGRRV